MLCTNLMKMASSVFDLTASIIRIATTAWSTIGTSRWGQIRTAFQRASQYSTRQFRNNDENKHRAIVSRPRPRRFHTDRYSGKWGVRSWGKSYNKVTISYLVRAKIRNFISRPAAAAAGKRWEALPSRIGRAPPMDTHELTNRICTS